MNLLQSRATAQSSPGASLRRSPKRQFRRVSPLQAAPRRRPPLTCCGPVVSSTSAPSTPRSLLEARRAVLAAPPFARSRPALLGPTRQALLAELRTRAELAEPPRV